MERIAHNPATVPAPVGGYSQALEMRGGRLLFISGQIPERADGTVPKDFAGQCQAVWDNIGALLAAAGMSYANLIKVTTYLTSRELAKVNSHIRQKVLGDARPALTVVVAQTLDPAWLLEIEAIAAAD
ncbi:MAG TPA: RidA family protein [Herpetosiphonaceae bacterium]